MQVPTCSVDSNIPRTLVFAQAPPYHPFLVEILSNLSLHPFMLDFVFFSSTPINKDPLLAFLIFYTQSSQFLSFCHNNQLDIVLINKSSSILIFLVNHSPVASILLLSFNLVAFIFAPHWLFSYLFSSQRHSTLMITYQTMLKRIGKECIINHCCH